MRIKSLLLFLGISAIVGCAKEEKSILPNVLVNLTIRLDVPPYTLLQTPATSQKVIYYNSITVGYRGNGVIIMHEIDDNFYAYDATCTNPSCFNNKPQSIDITDATFAVCPYCKTKFNLFNGYSMNNGSLRLKPYQVMKSGYQLNVYN